VVELVDARDSKSRTARCVGSIPTSGTNNLKTMKTEDSKALSFHEGKSCDAVLRVLERRLGATRRDVRSPERDRDSAPIELTCAIADQLFALEHTGIEPFSGHVQLTAEADRHFGPIVDALSVKLGTNHNFQLHIPAGALQGRKKKEIAGIQGALIENVAAIAPGLPVAKFGRYVIPIKAYSFEHVPFEVEVHHSEPHLLPGRFTIHHRVENKEKLREDRMREACRKKVPKLAEWRKKAGARTILILEDNDIQLTNPQVVYEALAKVEREFADPPDEIYMVTAIIAETWWVHALRVEDEDYYRLSEAGRCLSEFDPAQLGDVTAEIERSQPAS
jgi:hypothetical protein